MDLTIMPPEKSTELQPRILVIGVGGAGCNALNNIWESSKNDVEFLACNTDAQSIKQCKVEHKIQLGIELTQGQGAGMDPDIGKRAAEESIEEIADYLDGCHMAFITAGMGGGTGTGAAPVIAAKAREMGILTVGVITKPFLFEGPQRNKFAESGIINLQENVDTLIVISNNNLFNVAKADTTFLDAFKIADDVLLEGVKGVTDLMMTPGMINLDFADIRTAMKEMGKAHMGSGEAEGEDRAKDAAQQAISNPLLEDLTLATARGLIINVTGGYDMTLHEVDIAANLIREQVSDNANIIFGSILDESMEGKIRVVVVATGIESNIHAFPNMQKPQYNLSNNFGTIGIPKLGERIGKDEPIKSKEETPSIKDDGANIDDFKLKAESVAKDDVFKHDTDKLASDNSSSESLMPLFNDEADLNSNDAEPDSFLQSDLEETPSALSFDTDNFDDKKATLNKVENSQPSALYSDGMHDEDADDSDNTYSITSEELSTDIQNNSADIDEVEEAPKRRSLLEIIGVKSDKTATAKTSETVVEKLTESAETTKIQQAPLVEEKFSGKTKAEKFMDLEIPAYLRRQAN